MKSSHKLYKITNMTTVPNFENIADKFNLDLTWSKSIKIGNVFTTASLKILTPLGTF
jgi:hypothetical protein